jgi:predicted dehydrogenase
MIKLGFVGLGWWGQELAKAAGQLPNRLEIAAAFDPDARMCEEFSRTYNAPSCNSYAEMLANPALDGVVLSTPHSLHAEQIVLAAKAGKHIFVEKPLALNLEDAIRALSICAARQIQLAVGHNRRFAPAAQHLQLWVDQGRLGQILHVEAHFSGNSALKFTPQTWRANDVESPAGSLVSIGLHMIDTIQWLLSPIQRLSCISKRQVLDVPMNDTTAVLFELESGVTGTLGTLFATPLKSMLRVYGTRGMAEAKGDFTELTWHDDQGAPAIIPLENRDTLFTEMASFCDALEQHVPFPVAPTEAARNVAVIDACRKSSGDQGLWVNVATVQA